MSKLGTFANLLLHSPREIPWAIYRNFAHSGIVNFIPDKTHLKICYRLVFGKKLNLDNPKLYSEKIQWLKLYNRKPEFTVQADKYLVKDYVAEKIGREHIIPTLGAWDSFEEIDFDKLPDRFVLKCNHDCGGLVICKDKSKLDIKAAEKKIKKSLKVNFYHWGREWPYKNIPRKILCEEFLDQGEGRSLMDYKVMCFNGKAKLIEMHNGRFSGSHTQDFYDTDWNLTDHHQIGDLVCETPMEKPVFLDEMLRLSEILAEGLPHVRVDWYYVDGVIYFGEITFFDGSGFDAFEPESDEILGSWITLPDQKFEEK